MQILLSVAIALTLIVAPACCLVADACLGAAEATQDSRPRLVILTDIGGDPDDQQSMVRLMVYANAFRIEGLIATSSGTPGELKDPTPKPDLIRQIIRAYQTVRPNLVRHADRWPTANNLLSIVHVGNKNRGVHFVGPGHDSDASNYLIHKIDDGSASDPLNISIWGGQTDLAQALWRVRKDRSDRQFKDFVSRFRVYDIGDQDGLADWMRTEFPGLFYILSKAKPGTDKRNACFRGMYLTGDEDLTSRKWIDDNVRSTGPLGKLYPTKTWTAPNSHACMKEGDTPSWFFFLPAGGNNPNDPTKPGWGGRFYQADDGWFRDDRIELNPREEVSRWRPDFQKDFARRMSWCRDE